MSYFLNSSGVQTGPFTLEQFRALQAEGRIPAEALYWCEGMAEWHPFAMFSEVVQATASDLSTRSFAGFWRRLAAFVVDMIFLGVIGFLLGTVFFDFFSRLGTYGPIVGLVLAGLYFGLLDSKNFGGQTLGKRLLKIVVLGNTGLLISIPRSFGRFAVWGVPYFLWAPLSGSDPLATSSMVVAPIFFIWLAVITYLFVFNRPTRQTLPDLVANTYVANLSQSGSFPPTVFWKPHVIILVALSALALGLFGTGYFLVGTFLKSSFAELIAIQRALISQPDIQSASVVAGQNVTWINGKTRSSTNLVVNAQWNGKPKNMGDAARTVAGVVLDKGLEEATKQENLVITISYGYNIGLASGQLRQNYPHTVTQWQDIVRDSSAP